MSIKDSEYHKVAELAQKMGKNWSQSQYYDMAEKYMDEQWENQIWSMINDCDFSCVVDLAAGHGRNSEKLKELSKKIIIVDVDEQNIEYCRHRFAGNDKFSFLRNDGVSLKEIEDNSVSLIYCYDSMVHFDSDVIRLYLRDFYRVLKPGGLGFCHYSNYTERPGGDFRDNPHMRNFMSQQLFHHYCAKEGLAVVRSKLIQWELPALDCLTVFEKPITSVSEKSITSLYRGALRKASSLLKS